MKFSVIILICDRFNFIEEAISSVLSQSLKPNEILIINNGFNKFHRNKFENNKLIKVINAVPYIGIANALNIGVSISKYEYLVFLEDDDLWKDTYLENLKKKFEQGYDCCVSPILKLENGKISLYKTLPKNFNYKEFIFRNPGLNISNFSIKKSVLYELRGFDNKHVISVDKDIGIKIYENKKNIAILDDPLTISRFHNIKRLSKNKNSYFKKIMFFLNYSRLFSPVLLLREIKRRLNRLMI